MSISTPFEPSPAERQPFHLRLPHWGWFLAASLVLASGGIALWVGGHIYRQRAARESIERVGGSISTERNCPEWLSEWCAGSETISSFFDDIVTADMDSEKVTDADVKPLWVLSRLTKLDLSGGQITDAGLRSLAGLEKMNALDLSDTLVTEAGLVHLRGMKHLKQLDLPGFVLTE